MKDALDAESEVYRLNGVKKVTSVIEGGEKNLYVLELDKNGRMTKCMRSFKGSVPEITDEIFYNDDGSYSEIKFYSGEKLGFHVLFEYSDGRAVRIYNAESNFYVNEAKISYTAAGKLSKIKLLKDGEQVKSYRFISLDRITEIYDENDVLSGKITFKEGAMNIIDYDYRTYLFVFENNRVTMKIGYEADNSVENRIRLERILGIVDGMERLAALLKEFDGWVVKSDYDAAGLPLSTARVSNKPSYKCKFKFEYY
jgi:antitoxin component YwqK of YwqJK toxin-antitoxin module